MNFPDQCIYFLISFNYLRSSWRNLLTKKSDNSKSKLKKRDSSLRAIVSSSSIAPAVKPANLTPSLFYKFQCDSGTNLLQSKANFAKKLETATTSLPLSQASFDKDKKFLTLDEREALKKKEKELNAPNSTTNAPNKPFSFSSNSISKSQLKNVIKNPGSMFTSLNKSF